MKHLYRSETNKKWAGIIGGIGEYYEVDPTLLRLAWILFVIITGIVPGLLAYFVAALIVPRRPNR